MGGVAWPVDRSGGGLVRRSAVSHFCFRDLHFVLATALAALRALSGSSRARRRLQGVACSGRMAGREAMAIKTTITWDEFLAAGQEGQRWEWVDGEVEFMSPASPRHEQFLMFLIESLARFCRAHR